MFNDATDLKYNCSTLIIGTVFHVVTFAYLRSVSLRSGGDGIIGQLFNWYMYIVVADISSMAIIYKNYYNRTILSEIDPSQDDNYEWDEENHKYVPKQRSQSQTRLEEEHGVDEVVQEEYDEGGDNVEE